MDVLKGFLLTVRGGMSCCVGRTEVADVPLTQDSCSGSVGAGCRQQCVHSPSALRSGERSSLLAVAQHLARVLSLAFIGN